MGTSMECSCRLDPISLETHSCRCGSVVVQHPLLAMIGNCIHMAELRFGPHKHRRPHTQTQRAKINAFKEENTKWTFAEISTSDILDFMPI